MPTMICPKCNCQTDKDDPFCGKCGTKMIPVCQSCGARLKQDAEFCSQCGAKRKKVSGKTASERATHNKKTDIPDKETTIAATTQKDKGNGWSWLTTIIRWILIIAFIRYGAVLAEKTINLFIPYKNDTSGL